VSGGNGDGSPFLRVLPGVAQQILQNIFNPFHIHPQGRDAPGHFANDADLLFLEQRRQLHNALFYHGTDVRPGEGKIHLPGFHAREVQDPVDRGDQPVTFFLDHPEQFVLLLRKTGEHALLEHG